jgi:hypothetical protein
LGEVLAESEIEDLALTLGQVLGGGEDRRLSVDQLEPLVLLSERLDAAG